MSGETITWAMGQRVGHPVAKFVLIMLGEFCDQDGGFNLPMTNLEKTTELPGDIIEKIVSQLVKEGHILQGRDAHSYYSDRNYRLAMPLPVLPEKSRPSGFVRKAIPRELREYILHRDDRECKYCGAGPHDLVCDHVIPVSRGGTNDPLNLVAACKPCNARKGAKTIAEWVQ